MNNATHIANLTDSLDNINNLSGPELLSLYNECAAVLGAKPVSRFATKVKGQQRTECIAREAIAALKAASMPGDKDAVSEPASAVELSLAEALAEEAGSEVPEASGASELGDEFASVRGLPCRACGSEEGFDETEAGLECRVCKALTKRMPQKRDATEARSSGVARTWADPAVRAKRAERTSVKVYFDDAKGALVGEYKSVGAAFRALGLPLSAHIPFRMDLKGAEGGRMIAMGYRWVAETALPGAKATK